MLMSQGRTRGYLFGAGNDDSPKLANFHDVFYEVLEEVQQARGDRMRPDLEVREAYGMLRSLRRSATAHAINMQIPKDIVEAANR